MMVKQVFLSPLVDQLTGFVQVTKIQMIQHLFNSCRAIGKTDLEENVVKMTGLYDPVEPLAQLIDELKKGMHMQEGRRLLTR